MAMTVLSPHSGRPVKVREQDIGRALRDEQGKVFYVLPRSDGQGHYASATRAPSAQQEQRYAQLQAQAAATPASPADAHNAAGSGVLAGGARGKLVIVAFVLAALAVLALWLFTVGPWGNVQWQPTPGSPTPGSTAPGIAAPGSEASGMSSPVPSTLPAVPATP